MRCCTLCTTTITTARSHLRRSPFQTTRFYVSPSHLQVPCVQTASKCTVVRQKLQIPGLIISHGGGDDGSTTRDVRPKELPATLFAYSPLPEFAVDGGRTRLRGSGTVSSVTPPPPQQPSIGREGWEGVVLLE